MKTHDAWPLRRFDELSAAEIDTADRARKQWEEPEAWHLPHMTRLVTGCNGNCDQGDKCNCGPKEAASSCTEIGADGVPSVWEPADRQVMPVFIAAFLILAASSYHWATTGEFLPALIGAVVALVAFAALIGMLQP